MDVALVGVVIRGVENHSLAVLGRALAEAGLEHRVVPFGGFAAMDRTIAQVLALRPRVCGVSLQTTESALAVLSFTRLLRARGFAGVIAVGGHLATLAADEILRAPAAVDVVIRLAGEQAIVGLARGEHPHSLPGTITRDGSGQPPLPVRPEPPEREHLADHLGFGAADVVASHGCEAHCSYCCVAAASDLARTVGPRHERRPVDDIAGELAELAARGGRAVHFMDDNLLPLDPAEALTWAGELGAALAARRVPPIAFSLQLRADVVAPALARALAGLGLVRAYVGIDGYSPGQLRALGRAAPAAAGNAALAALDEAGVLCVANALLIGPTIGFDTIVREIEALATVRHAPVHLLPIEVRPGTAYYARAAGRGLLEGGLLWPAHRFEDERSFRVGQVVTGLPTRLAERSVPIGLYDLAWALGTARRLAPEADTGDAVDTYRRVTAAWNADQIRILRAAAEAARLGQSAVDALLAAERPVVRGHDTALLRACDTALLGVERAVSVARRRRVRAHARGRLLGGLAFAMGLAAAGCGDSTPEPDAPVAADAALPDGIPADAAASCPGNRTPLDGFEGCDFCAENVDVLVTVDAEGVITAITDANGDPLPADLEQCLLDFFAPYCYPSLAGTTQSYTTCHTWIA